LTYWNYRPFSTPERLLTVVLIKFYLLSTLSFLIKLLKQGLSLVQSIFSMIEALSRATASIAWLGAFLMDASRNPNSITNNACTSSVAIDVNVWMMDVVIDAHGARKRVTFYRDRRIPAGLNSPCR
jgi:hypothetical protein